MRSLHYVRIEVVPESVYDAIRLHTTVKIAGREDLHHSRVYPLDDFTSVFDLLWNDLGLQLKEAIKE